MIKGDFTYHVPKSLSMAYELKTKTEHSAYLGGGTDYIPCLKYNLKKPSSIISLNKIIKIKEIRKEENGIFIGAMTTLREIYESKDIQRSFPSLYQATRKVASPQIRNVATIGGNILQDRRCIYFNQSDEWRINIDKCFKLGGQVCLQVPTSKKCRALYYSDIAPVLLSLGAKAEIFNGKFSRISVRKILEKHIALNGFTNTHDYILTGFFIPKLPEKSWTKFEKHSLRDSLNFSIINVGIRYSQLEDDLVVKIIVGSASPIPIELKETEDIIINKFGDLEEYKDDIKKIALSELLEKSQLVREAGISIKVKRNIFKIILNVIEELIAKITDDK